MTPQVGELVVTRLSGEQIVFLYDPEDHERVTAHTWRAQPRKQAGRFYAMTGHDPCIYLHALLAGAWADHINGDSQDNRRRNLRAADPVGNAANRPPRSTSGYKGVTRHRNGRWQAAIAKKYLGLFDTPEEAALAYNQPRRGGGESSHG